MTPHTDTTELSGLGRVHLIGVGGAGMSAIARILLARGVSVSGSDTKESATTTALRTAGAQIVIGHDAANIADVDTVVISTAIRENNPELAAAREQGLRILHRSQALAATMEGKRPIAISGTHGKTTTTAMITVILKQVGADPSFAIGGNVASLGVNAEYGAGDEFVFEADESDGSFLNFSPAIEVITNAEADHLDHYGSVEAVFEAFGRFIDRLEPGGTLIVCQDDPGARSLLVGHRDVSTLSYGFDESAQVRVRDFRAVGSGSTGTIEDVILGTSTQLTLAVPGKHNMQNALAAYCVGRAVGLAPARITTALATFTGAARRFELKGEIEGVRVFDDYSHHPTEVNAALNAARDLAADGRVFVLFQPHLFSRTQRFAVEFAEALGLADRAWVLPIFAAREDPMDGVTSALIVGADATGRIEASEVEDAMAALLGTVHSSDIILTMGAGDVTRYGPEIVSRLRAASEST